MAEIPKQIAELIAKFDQNSDAYYEDVIHEDAVKAGGDKSTSLHNFIEANCSEFRLRSQPIGRAEGKLEVIPP